MRLLVDIQKQLANFTLKIKFETNDEMLAILGSSGSGKTMTLRCIAGIEKPDKGRIVLGDRVLFDSDKKINVPARDRRIGFMFQDYALFPNMTVRENIAYTARDKSKVDNIIERFDLAEVRDHYPSKLSGGQSQRTAMARMLLTDPEMIMFDEPFAALDNYLKYRIEHEILDIIGDFEGPKIMVSHDRNEVYRLSDLIAVVDRGELGQVQSPKEFFDHPQSVVATRLTGCKNISRIDVGDEITAVDWGIKIGGNADKKYKYVGYRAHYFELTDSDGLNVFDCALERIIDDTFSVTVCFRQKDNEINTHDSLLTWVIPANKWASVKEPVLSGEFKLRLDPSQLIFLER